MPARLPRTPSALSTLPSLIILGNVMRTLAMPKVAEPWWSESASAPNMGVFTLDGVGLLFYGGATVRAQGRHARWLNSAEGLNRSRGNL